MVTSISHEGMRLLAQGVLISASITSRVLPRRIERGAPLTNRNGYRERRWDTRVGTIGLAIPKVRDGSYPSLLERLSLRLSRRPPSWAS